MTDSTATFCTSLLLAPVPFFASQAFVVQSRDWGNLAKIPGVLHSASAWGNLNLNLLPPELAPYPRDYQLFGKECDPSPFFKWESFCLTCQPCSGDTQLGGETTSARARPSKYLIQSMEVFPGRGYQNPGFLLSVMLWEQAHMAIQLILNYSIQTGTTPTGWIGESPCSTRSF